MAFKLYVCLGFLGFVTLWRALHQRVFRWLSHRLHEGKVFVIDKLSYYIGLLFSSLVALRMIGADVSDLLATAGVLTVAIGFAAKTSMSHFISGFILLGTRLIKRGDIIEVGEHLGVVENIDVFSTHLRTFDHVLVSLPNEKLLTEYVTNYSRYSMRRISCELIIHAEDLSAELSEAISARLAELPVILVEPAPMVMITSEPGRGIKLSLRAWCESSQLIEARNQLIIEVTALLTAREVRFVTELVAQSS